jgi:hypothetical protein
MEYAMTTDISCLDDLSFTACDADGIRSEWQPERGALSIPAAMIYGLNCVTREIAQLARVDEHDAYTAIVQALTARTWNDQCAEEYGFADGLARLALIGLRALAMGEDCPFPTEFDVERARQASLAIRVEVMEAQLKALKVKPWRTYAQAGLA